MRSTLIAALAATVVLSPAPALANTAPAWVTAPPVPLPADATEAVLRDVSVVTPTDVWAVGAWIDRGSHTLAAHWDGSGWTTVPTPDAPNKQHSYGLSAVDAVASDDVWAVGEDVAADNPGDVGPLLLHYDGTAWREWLAPSGVDGSLADVDLVTAGEGWAVGNGAAGPLMLRWTADRWAPVKLPPLPSAASLVSVFTTSTSDAWAVGSQPRGDRRSALVLHWDGALWTEVTVPDAGPLGVTLTGVAASSPADVWAVGAQCEPVQPPSCEPRVLRYVAGAWMVIQTALPATLTEVVPFGPDDVWIFGEATSPIGTLDHVEHWNGRRFEPESTMPGGTGNNQPASALSLAAADGDPATGLLWAVGWVRDGARTTHAIYRP
jgi:hypothetical protein